MPRNLRATRHVPPRGLDRRDERRGRTAFHRYDAVSPEEETAMKRLSVIAIGLLVVASIVVGCAQMSGSDPGWITLIDGTSGLDNWNRVGDANWRAEDGAIVADKGKGGFLVSKNSYKDFQIRAEFWAATDTNSGVFIRCDDPVKIGAATCYEVNIWDIR